LSSLCFVFRSKAVITELVVSYCERQLLRGPFALLRRRNIVRGIIRGPTDRGWLRIKHMLNVL